MSQEITTLDSAKQYAAQHGIVLSSADTAKVSAAQVAELERLAALESDEKKDGWAEKFNRAYPTVLNALHGAGETILTLAQTIIVAFGIPVTLVLLMIVEHQRVYHGIALFETSPDLASFAALALVVLNLVLEFQIHYVEHKAGYTADRETLWSLRLWLANAAYTIGMGERWQPRLKSPAARYRRLLGLVTFSILALALAGSMHTAIEQQTGAWHVAIVNIITESSLSEMMVWLGGLLFAAAAVLSAQGLSRYVALRCAEIVASMGSTSATTPAQKYASEIDSAAAAVVVALVNEKLSKKAKTTESPRPFGSAVPEMVAHEPMTHTMNGNGRNGSTSANGGSGTSQN